MAHPMSLRFRDPSVADRLKAEAAASRRSSSVLAEELIDEGLRARRHPLVGFRSGPAGRRAALVGGPDVWEVISGMIGGDVPSQDRVLRSADLLGIRPGLVEAALAYYAEYTDEIDFEIESNATMAEESEALWRRQQDLLAR